MFYKEIETERAVALIDEIVELADTADRAAKLIELFINNLMTVEEIELILF